MTWETRVRYSVDTVLLGRIGKHLPTFTVPMFTLVVVCSMTAFGLSASQVCETLQECLDEYPVIAQNGLGISTDEQELARQIQGFGPDAIPYLINLLEHNEAGIRQLAGYTLRDISGLGPEHLEPLIRASEAGDGWIPPAIARIGTPKAIAYLVGHIRKNPQTNTQFTYALQILGANGAPAIAEFYSCTKDCGERMFAAASSVLHELGDEAVAVIPRLLEIAVDNQLMFLNRQYAIAAIGWIGPSGAIYAPELLDLREQEPKLAAAINYALLEIGSSEAVPPLLDALPDDPENVLFQISRLGPGGYTAGSAVLLHLNSLDWDIRVAAAEALGHIGYSMGAASLAAALNDQDDWKLVYAASLSLARLGASKFIGDLESVSTGHWYPPVRDVADLAIKHLRSGVPLDDDGWWRISTAENSPEPCASLREEAIQESKSDKLYANDSSAKLQEMSYETIVSIHFAPEGAERSTWGVFAGTGKKKAEVVELERVQRVPNLAQRVTDGWLAGSNRGEWGGELVYISDRGENTILYHDNIHDIFTFSDWQVATTGLAHLASDEGALLRIKAAKSGQYSVEKWKRLPGAPRSSWLVDTDQLLINTYGGSVIVDGDGNLRMARCTSK